MLTSSDDMKSLQEYIQAYIPSEQANDALWNEFTHLTNTISYLRDHRDWVEKYNWGFGDRAFHYMWYLLLTQETLGRVNPTLLEIGVYKGQVISLWSLIAAKQGAMPHIYAISPLTAGHRELPSVLHRIGLKLSRRYRENVESRNHYPKEDYTRCIEQIFSQFDLDVSSVHFLKGYSQDRRIKAQAENLSFDMAYVDGGHRYDEVLDDMGFYGKRVKIGGYLVLDDASYFQPGTLFWKGHESVSRAAEEIDTNNYKNILNVGHNRVYQRLM
jgi:cephalosporin hydroxylase